MGKFGIEADQQVMVLEAGQGARKGRRGREVRYVVQLSCGAECWDALGMHLWDLERRTEHGRVDCLTGGDGV